MSSIKLLIVDDNARFRHLIQEILGPEEDIRVCGESATIANAKELLGKYEPDVALVDIALEEYDGGLKFVREMSKMNLATNFIVLSAYNETQYSVKSLEAGAKAYVCKDKIVPSLTKAIRCVCSGREFVSANV